jgi:hypothetical protein
MIACFGAIAVLAFYNLFLGVSLRDKSYLFYSAYLFFSLLGWAGAFNAVSAWFGWYSYGWLIPPFFMTVICNTLYYIHFLELPQSNPALSRFSYAVVIVALLSLLSYPLLSAGHYMFLYGVISSIWISNGLYCGLQRLREGYKPARYLCWPLLFFLWVRYFQYCIYLACNLPLKIII